MEEYIELCKKFNYIIDDYWGLLDERNPIYEFIAELLECIRKEKGISEEVSVEVLDDILGDVDIIRKD